MPTEPAIARRESRITESLLISRLRVDLIPDLDAVVAEVEDALRGRYAWLMTFVNPGSAGAARKQPALTEALKEFDLVGADGIGVVHLVNWLLKRPIARVSFDSTSLAPRVFALAVSAGYEVVLCGGAPGVAEAAAASIRATYPYLMVSGVFDGFVERDKLVNDIAKLSPAIVICGMGTLHQEHLLLKLRDAGWGGVGFTCGGYFDQLAQGFVYYPRWVDRANLRFLYRLWREPGRLWRRYTLDYPPFWLGARGYTVVKRRGK